jgi:probable H4MPT-linked C1 transfer pathway protein
MASDGVIGWDVGGAHLKAARLGTEGTIELVLQLACPLWQGLSHLETALTAALARLGSADRHAITMTGEMADLFPGRREGVVALAETMQRFLTGGDLWYFAGDAGLVGPDQVPAHAARIASANWMASAALVAARCPAALFLDIGSTTTDLVPVAGGRVLAQGRDDYSRLVAGELVYTGVVRTPLMAIADAVQFGTDLVPLMAEYFATMADVYRVTGELPEGADLHPAADGGARDVAASTRRLGRMIGRDLPSATPAEWRALADAFRARQVGRLEAACARQLARGLLPDGAPIVGAGVGRFLAGALAARCGRPFLDFADLLPPSAAPRGQLADCAPAVAVALLARDVFLHPRERSSRAADR